MTTLAERKYKKLISLTPGRENPGHIDNVHGREKLPLWAQERLREFEMNFDISGSTAITEGENTLLIIPEEGGITVAIPRKASPKMGYRETIELRFAKKDNK